jgi:ATP-dependent RNA helicase DHX37/DHR1
VLAGQVDARQFPVVSHFARRTEIDNYLHETFRKVVQIHRKLPSGGTLLLYYSDDIEVQIGDLRASDLQKWCV